MRAMLRGWKRTMAMALLALSGLAMLTGTALGIRNTWKDAGPMGCEPCPELCQTIYCAGEEDEALQVHIGGVSRNVLEAYFAHNYLTDTIEGTQGLHCYGRVLMGRPGSGTFLVQYGRDHEKFVAYGFYRKNELVKITNDPANWKPNRREDQLVSQTAGYPVCFMWISTRVLKITHGPNGTVTTVVRFNPENGIWSLLDGTKPGGVPIAGPKPGGKGS